MSLALALEAYDEDALATLANRGLVRRAKKDVESGAVSDALVEDDTARVVVAGETVRIGAGGPSEASCSCPSASTCRHVIAAILHLRANPALFGDVESLEAGGDLVAELLGLSLEAIAAWAKKRPFESAVRLFRLGSTPSIEASGTSVVVRFADGVEVRFLAGAGLDGALYKGAKAKRVVRAVTALLALREEHGFEVPEARASVLADVRGAARTRPECVGDARRLARDLVHAGISHVSDSARDRATTLGLSCVAANLPRLGAALRRVATELELTLDGHASADASRLLARVAALDALARALNATLPAGRADLVGRHRSEYSHVGTLALVGLGAWSFVTPSGYRGLTLLFLAPRTGGLHTWTDARPDGVDPNFSPLRRYLEGAPVWPGGGAHDLCRHQFELRDALANDEGRLSGRDASHAVLGAPTSVHDIGARLQSRWSDVRARAGALWPLGLSRPAVLDDIAILRPTASTDVRFDEIGQALLLDLVDDVGDRLTLRLLYTPEHQNAVRWLASKRLANEERPMRWVVRLERSEGPLRATPLALWLEGEPDELINLHLDPVEQAPMAPWWRSWERLRTRGVRSARLMVAGAGDEDETSATPWPEGTERAVAVLEDEALARAESGVRVLRDRARMREAVFQVRRRGLSDLADAAEAVLDDATAERVLALAYLTQVHRQAARRHGHDRSVC